MAEGLSRNEAAQNAREIVAESLSYQEAYETDLRCANLWATERGDIEKAVAILKPAIENAIENAMETMAKIVEAFAEGMNAFSEAFAQAMSRDNNRRT